VRRLRYLGLALIAACAAKPAPKKAPELADFLLALSGSDEPKRAAAIAKWTLSRDEWNRIVVEPYKIVYDDYVRELDAMRPALVKLLAEKHPVETRAHFAGDPLMSRGQAITRWALPTLAPARIAELSGRPTTAIDAVFVDVGGQWRAIVGMDKIIKQRAADCASVFDRIDPKGGTCIEAAWSVADAALRDQRPRFMHACSIATNACRR
jgi:hypothetical protein